MKQNQRILALVATVLLLLTILIVLSLSAGKQAESPLPPETIAQDSIVPGELPPANPSGSTDTNESLAEYADGNEPTLTQDTGSETLAENTPQDNGAVNDESTDAQPRATSGNTRPDRGTVTLPQDEDPLNPRRQRVLEILSEKEMIALPAGNFEMGSRGMFASRDQKPARQVTLDAFKISRTEVTQGLWKAVMGANPSCREGDDLPVENVSFYDVMAFLEELNALLESNYRLPTEAEWEYACSSNETDAAITEVAWFDRTSQGKTWAVGSKPAGKKGLVDLQGNVWEWCADWYGERYYREAPSANPTGPEKGAERVIRGGGWDARSEDCKCPARASLPVALKNCGLGFRLAQSNLPVPND